MKSKPALILSCASLSSLAVFIVYLPSLANGFVLWDDDLYVLQNRFIRHLGERFLRMVFTTPVASNWHPLTVIAYAVDYRLWGLNPFGYHLENIILHALNAFLVAVLAARLYEIKAKDSSSSSSGVSAALAGLGAGLLFGLHPLHVESVSWISELKDVLSFFFFLLSILAYVRYVLNVSRTSKRDYIMSFIFFAAALMSKPMAISLPFVLITLDFYPFERLSVRNATIEKAPFFVLSAASAILTILAQQDLLRPLSELSFPERAAIAIRSYAFYIWKMFSPTGLLPFYSLPARSVIFDYVFEVSLAVIVLISVLSVVAARKNRLYLATWLYYVITLFPVAGLIKVGDQSAADRYSYYPLTAFFILASVGACKLRSRLNTALAFAFVAAVLSFLTLRQEKIWRNSFTLWNAELSAYPDLPTARNQRGLANMQNGAYRQAISDFTKAVEGAPDYHEAWNNLGVAYYKTGAYSVAISDLTRALVGAPSYAEAYNNRANAYSSIKDYPKAIEDYTAAIRSNPAYGQAYVNRGILYRITGEYGRAIDDFTTARKLDPTDSLPYTNLGVTYLLAERYGAAIENLKAAVTLAPRNAAAYYYLGNAYSKTGDAGRASAYYNKAARLSDGRRGP